MDQELAALRANGRTQANELKLKDPGRYAKLKVSSEAELEDARREALEDLEDRIPALASEFDVLLKKHQPC